jgi:hypothetical protein
MGTSEKFRLGLRELLMKEMGCDVQHDGWPCNTCFHSWARDVLGDGDLAHLLWILVLRIRGDYKEEPVEFFAANKEFFEALVRRLNEKEDGN